MEPKRAAVFEQGDVADVEEVEAAVGEDDGLAGGAPVGDAELDAFEVEDLFGAAERSRAGREERRRARGAAMGDGADFADDDAGGEIGEVDGGFDLEASGEAGGEGGDDGVAGAGDVEDLAGAGGRVIEPVPARRTRTWIPVSLMVTVRNSKSCSATMALGRRRGVRRVWWAGMPVAAESSPRLGQTVVAPEYLLKSGVLGSTRTGMPQRRAARMTASQSVVGERALGVVGEDDGVDLCDELE